MTAVLPQAQVGVIGGSGFYEFAGFTDRQGGRCGDAVRVSERRADRGAAGRYGRGVSASPRSRAPHHALRAAGARQHSCPQAVRCAVGDLGWRRGQYARGNPPARSRRTRPALRPHQMPPLHVLRRRPGRPRRLCRAVLSAVVPGALSGGASRLAPVSMPAAHTCVSRDRSSPRRPNRAFTASGAWT